jgi:hypothetical protein
MEETAIDIITPVMEGSVVLAGEYMKACGRRTLTAQDLQYALKYCICNMVGKHIGTLFPEDSDSESGSDLEVVDEDDEPFVRYSGDDQLMNDINHAVDTWGEWEPSSPIEVMLRDSANISW